MNLQNCFEKCNQQFQDSHYILNFLFFQYQLMQSLFLHFQYYLNMLLIKSQCHRTFKSAIVNFVDRIQHMNAVLSRSREVIISKYAILYSTPISGFIQHNN